jgi:hypothetical protein
MPAAITVQVANGLTLQCTSHMQQASWPVADYQFITDLKALPLSSYDMILGLDWLESFSPMKIDWKKKWILLKVKICQPSHEFTFGVGMTFVSYPLVLTPVV